MQFSTQLLFWTTTAGLPDPQHPNFLWNWVPMLDANITDFWGGVSKIPVEREWCEYMASSMGTQFHMKLGSVLGLELAFTEYS